MFKGSEPQEKLEIEREVSAEEPEAAPEQPQTPWERIKAALRQTRETPQMRNIPARREMGKDRTKSLVLLAGAAIGVVLMFLGVFSSPQKPQTAQSRRTSCHTTDRSPHPLGAGDATAGRQAATDCGCRALGFASP